MNPLFFLFALLGARGLSSGGSDSGGTRTEQFISQLDDEEDTGDAPEQEQVEEVDEPAIVVDPQVPDAPEQPGDGGSGGDTTPVSADGTIEVLGGRVTTLAPASDDLAEVKIVSGVEHGTVTVNPDGTFALVMTQSDFLGSQSFTYEATHSDGSTTLHEIGLNVTAGPQEGGWGTGEAHYMLATDENDRVIVETGENHTKVYISGGENAISLEEIAANEGMSVGEITGDWLAAHGEYGASEGMALNQEAGTLLWQAVSPPGSVSSNWLLLERGYQYDDLGRFVDRGATGEDELTPLYVGAWGEGDRPEITSYIRQYQEPTENVVFQDIHFSGGILILEGNGIIFDNAKFTDYGIAVQDSAGITIRNTEFYDIHFDSPKNGGDWEAHVDRITALYMNSTEGALLEGNFFDHVGWVDGFDPDGSATAGQPPSMFSHNVYLDSKNIDATFRDTISMRSSSYGMQLRSGGFIEDVVLLDNNAGNNFVGGDYLDAGPVGQYTLLSDTLITSAGYKEADRIGATSMGTYNGGRLTTMVDNIIAHLADPNNPDELAYKEKTNDSHDNIYDPYYDDTIVYNWRGSGVLWHDEITTEMNTEGLDTDVLDQTTIQIFAAELLGKPDATIADLADYLRAQSEGAFDDLVDADLILYFFQEGFGIAPDIRETEAALRFVPNDLGEGVRWDNRLNWDTEDLPGLFPGDDVDLGGNGVVFGMNATIDELAMSEGELDVYGGRLNVTGGVTDGGEIDVTGAGQIWIEGTTGDDLLDIDIDGGRFVNTGNMDDTDVDVMGGEVLLAADDAKFELSSGRTLAIFEAASEVGFDGEENGMAILDMQEGSTLKLGSSNGEMSSIEEFRSGAFGEETNVQSGIDLGSSTLELDLSGLQSNQIGSFTLLDADEIVGLFDEATLNIGGLGSRDASVVIDYINDSVTLELSSGGTGAINVSTIGDQRQSDHDALWEALTADQGLAENTPLPEDHEEDILAVA